VICVKRYAKLIAWASCSAPAGDFLMRLVARHGLAGAARMLRALAEELERRAG